MLSVNKTPPAAPGKHPHPTGPGRGTTPQKGK